MLNPRSLKKDFPIFGRQINGKPLVYLDNASTTQKPAVVIDALVKFYSTMNANVHRGVHTLSEEASESYENARTKVAQLIGAREPGEIIFTRNATESLNLVAYTWGEQNVGAGDEIVVSALEHHSNLVPWQELCRRKGAVLKILELEKTGKAKNSGEMGGELFSGNLDLANLDSVITSRCKLVAVTQLSNVLGTIVPLEKIIARAREVGAKVVVDGAQGVPHLGINVTTLDCDFLAFSSHKMFGPTGVGILYGKRELLEKMPPFLFGGDMVKEVSSTEANWNDVPWKFEAGTPNIAGVIAFGVAVDFMKSLNMKEVQEHDEKLVRYAREKLGELKGMVVYGPAESGGIVSFNVPGVHPHDVASILNEAGVAVRAGHHCAQPLMIQMNVPATTRFSFTVYNDEADVDVAIEALKNVYKIFKL